MCPEAIVEYLESTPAGEFMPIKKIKTIKIKKIYELGADGRKVYCLKEKYHLSTGWQKLRGSTGGTRRKVWTRTKILSPNIRYFVAN